MQGRDSTNAPSLKWNTTQVAAEGQTYLGADDGIQVIAKLIEKVKAHKLRSPCAAAMNTTVHAAEGRLTACFVCSHDQLLLVIRA